MAVNTPLKFPSSSYQGKMGTYEDLDLIIRFFFIFLLWPFPQNWHPRILPKYALCYIKAELPFSTSGDLDFVLLNQLNWGLLPIEQLWPVIRDNPATSQFLLDHCGEFSYEQVLWIAKNDPLNRVFLLTNHECMSKVKFYRLNMEDFQTHFEELPIYSVSNLESIPEEVILEGLSRLAYRFPSRDIQESFLSRLPLRLLNHPGILADTRSLHLFSANYLFKVPKAAFAYSQFLFRMDWAASKSLRWRISLLELIDLIEHQPVAVFLGQAIMKRCKLYVDEKININKLLYNPASVSTTGPFQLFRALQLRDKSFFTSIGSVGFIQAFGPEIGAFDQFRIISLLLPDNFDTFNDFFEANLFDDSVLRQFFRTKHEMVNLILPRAPLKLLRFLSLKWSEPRESLKTDSPTVVPHATSLDFHQLVALKIPQISSNNFKIKYTDDAVVDLGGPLLDWINGILQRLLELQLFSAPVMFEADARDFLDIRIFKLVGLLHGKLVQIGSKPAWIPAITGALLQNVASLAEYPGDQDEAVRLFNEFFFPGLSSTSTEPFRLCSHAEIRLYLTRITRIFNIWKSRAWEQYYAGLSVFLSDRIPRDLTLKLLRPLEPVTAAKIAANTLIKNNPELPHDLSQIWLQILESLSPDELIKLLIFTTGHCHLTRITLYFIVLPDRRLPFARTCFQKLFLYLVDPQLPQQALTEYLTQSILMSIHNYQGFGNI